MTGQCVPCALEDGDPWRVVFRDALWACEVFPGFEVPGWFVLRTRRHVVNLWNLDDREAGAYGGHLRRLSQAIVETLGSPAVYSLSFGERHPHFHTLVIPRGPAVPEELRSERILQLRHSQRDPEAAEEVKTAVAETFRHSLCS